ncbi:MAG: glycosyltransferase family 2 protein [Nitrospira sp.]|nr:glycosyltransferase family 2 protein [Nitrospira sp.]
MNTFEITFWLSLALVGYSYVGYPMLLWVLSFFRAYDVVRGDGTPSVTYIVTAYNEEKRITEKLDNTLALAYPSALLEVLVASDCSSDNTDAIVLSYAGRGIRLVRAPERKGKEAAQKLAVEVAKGEILVFSDVATILPKDAISNIVRAFQDPTVGCVSSVDRFIDQDGQVSGEGAYVKYEMFLRSLETRVNSLVGLSGSFFAARSVVCKQSWSDDLQSDFNTVLNCMRMGLRGVADPNSIGYYRNIADERKEFDRKVRTVLRGISVFMRSLVLVNPVRYPIFAWQLVSHKLCRWLVPFAMLSALTSNAALAVSSPWYFALLAMQSGFYAVGLGGLLRPALRRFTLVKLPAFYLLVNASIFKAWVQYWIGKRLVAWEPSKR